jgi:hypothetical protein
LKRGLRSTTMEIERFGAGPGEVKEGTRWQWTLERRDRTITTIVIPPLLYRYGYRLVGTAVTNLAGMELLGG